ncbi:sensor histidine kinase [Teichococcus cervicalis]|uniref:histidine kinase n=1 Tax=Pseudoroseomonas cervicalis ATCC 49957 TaxID=525371 RepID=D5RI28_9PROT|nr:DUF4118 domain-containing protein [Pseudoroseomonas cervicalis]EFH13057.1 ATPase/histidine kinase/DNA gyrase B/HSP90 domain protein [Pseudoroseomonas cervicalis ATCC 49957]
MLTLPRRLLELGIRDRSPSWRWGVAALLLVAALLARLLADPYLPPGFPFLTFFPAVIVTAFLCGTAPGLTVGALSGLAAWYLFIEPLHSFGMQSSVALALGFFMGVVGLDVLLIHVMNQSLRQLRAESARRSREAELSQLLARTREVMFEELQHRVSNNLQVLAAMMMLQRGAVQEPEARRVLDNAAQRLELIGRLQRSLHRPGEAGLPFGRFLEGLCQDVLQASGAQSVTAEIEAEPVALAPERTVPVALITAELVANAVEHAFRGGPGRLRIGLRREEGGTLALSVRDDGAGLAPGFVAAESRSLGLRIVHALAEQIGGRFEMRAAPGGGTLCRLVFAAE